MALLAVADQTVSHSHMEVFCFPSHVPSGSTKVATTAYADLRTLSVVGQCEKDGTTRFDL